MQLEIKPSHKPIKQYYDALAEFEKHGATKETSVRAAFQEILTTYARKKKWSFIAEEGITLANGNAGSVDGAIKDAWGGIIGYWEAKDEQDDLRKWIDKKFSSGYPRNNILFQKPSLAILIQDSGEADEYDLNKPERLAACIIDFLGYRADEQENWEQIVAQFKERIPESAKKVIEMIEVEKKDNARFKKAFLDFAELCRAAINPNLADEAVEEMLVQHLLTSRIFTSVFENPEFVRRNVIASEIEKVIDALTSRSFNRQQFFMPLDHFYRALENKAKSITDWSQKQTFLNTVYEKFFQGFAVKVADTHGIVYTPQPIVDFMVRSVQHILKTEFKRSLASEGVHILDPFVGTGNFIMRIIREIAAEQKSKLPKKYASELHCNEVMLLPYYIASMNIEHEYYTQTKEYKPFEGICLVDTFELAEGRGQREAFVDENKRRIERQQDSPIFVVIGNPPYNANQQNENDNNKNRKYKAIDKSVAETFGRASRAQNKNALSDPYVKAFRFAMNKLIADGGIAAFVSNNSFLTEVAFDGMRKHLLEQFDEIYLLDLGGNVRKNPKLSGTTHNVFGIQVGVSINILIRKKDRKKGQKAILKYARLPEDARKQVKLLYLIESADVEAVKWTTLEPDAKGTWLTSASGTEFETLLPIARSGAEKSGWIKKVFAKNSYGVQTNRDDWVCSFNEEALISKVKSTIGFYNSEVSRWKNRESKRMSLDDFLNYDDKEIKWSSRLKQCLVGNQTAEYDETKVRRCLYRPFNSSYIYFDTILVHRRMHIQYYFPKRDSDNTVITISGIGGSKPFQALITDKIPFGDTLEKTQCFPFYTYDEDGRHRRENITDWALGEFRRGLGSGVRGLEGNDAQASKVKKPKKTDPEPQTPDPSQISKWDIFYYVYGLLHHPEYRTKYAANLRRELPRIPISPDFWVISECGKQLADLHVNYESAAEYPLEEKWTDDGGLNFKVEKMKLTKDKSAIIYNKDLTLTGIPPEAFEYRLGNRSAIDWIIDQYQVSTDKRSGIVNDPNREEDEQYIVGLVKKIVTVSLETVRLVSEIAGTKLA